MVDPNHHLAHESASALTQAVRQCQFPVVGALPSGLVVFPLALDPLVHDHCCSSTSHNRRLPLALSLRGTVPAS